MFVLLYRVGTRPAWQTAVYAVATRDEAEAQLKRLGPDVTSSRIVCVGDLNEESVPNG